MDYDSVVRALETHGVSRIFGLPGTQTTAFFGALRKSRIGFTLATSELSAAFMANGYARASGRVGVLATIGGPGFTYALTGLAEARLDSVPLLHLVTAPATAPGSAFQLQAIDQPAIAGPLVKGCFTIERDDDIAPTLSLAMNLVERGEPGPVLVQFARGPLPGDRPRPLASTTPADFSAPDFGALRRRWASASRPLFLVGQGALLEANRVRKLVEKHGVPVVTTPSARGIIPEDHPLAMGFDTVRGGLSTLNELFERSDLILALGCKLTHNGSAGFRMRLPKDRLVHVDREPSVLEANYPCSLAIACDARDVVALLESGPTPAGSWSSTEVADFRRRLTHLDPILEPDMRGNPEASPSAFFSWLRAALPAETILVTDSGQHQVLARRHFSVLAPRGLILPSDFQSMGFGLPAAIGAKLGAPDRPVVALLGDGGLQMTGMELVNAVRDRIPLLVVVFNDGKLNQIRLQQIASDGRPFGVHLGRLNHQSFATAVGARYLSFSGSLDPASVSDALDGPGPTLLDVRVGDSWTVRAVGAKARLKTTVRRLLGPRLSAWMRAATWRVR